MSKYNSQILPNSSSFYILSSIILCWRSSFDSAKPHSSVTMTQWSQESPNFYTNICLKAKCYFKILTYCIWIDKIHVENQGPKISGTSLFNTKIHNQAASHVKLNCGDILKLWKPSVFSKLVVWRIGSLLNRFSWWHRLVKKKQICSFIENSKFSNQHY